MTEEKKKQDPKIVVKETTKTRLDKFGSKDDTYDSVLNMLMDIAERRGDTHNVSE